MVYKKWIILVIAIMAVNLILAFAAGVGNLRGATALSFVLGQVVFFPVVVAGLMALFKRNRQMSTPLKIIFWCSVLSLLVLLNLGANIW